jgi:hypothetical protein
MKWTRGGRIFDVSGQRPWMVSHAAMPIADPLGGDRYRVYFSSRDERNRARIGFFEMRLSDPHVILAVSDEPVLDLGPLGAFDDSGVTGGCLVATGGDKYLYYSGWTLGRTVPFYFYVGLAVSHDGGLTFRRVSSAPILERNAVDPYLTASPSVLIEDGLWRMWYVSGSGWSIEGGVPQHRYHIRYAESRDGVAWSRSGLVCLDYASPDERAFARPCVVHDGGRYRMWFSVRGPAYRLGYAESADGLVWERDDARAGLEVADAGWDSEMIAYSFVFLAARRTWMLYNGNGYGRTGIGYAVSA